MMKEIFLLQGLMKLDQLVSRVTYSPFRARNRMGEESKGCPPDCMTVGGERGRETRGWCFQEGGERLSTPESPRNEMPTSPALWLSMPRSALNGDSGLSPEAPPCIPAHTSPALTGLWGHAPCHLCLRALGSVGTPVIHSPGLVSTCVTTAEPAPPPPHLPGSQQ